MLVKTDASLLENNHAYSSGEKGDRLVHSPERRDIDSLTPHCPLRTDTCRVFSRTSVNDGINENLQYSWLAKNHFMVADGTDLDGVLVGEEVDDLKCMCDDANCHELLAVVAALHHQAAQS